MTKLIGTFFILLLSAVLSADNWMEICQNTLSTPNKNVVSYDFTICTASVYGPAGYDSLAVFAHSEMVNDSTTALVFSRWYVNTDPYSSPRENYIYQDTIILSPGVVIDQIQFPRISDNSCSLDNYNFDYLYFRRTINSQVEFCRVNYLGNGQFSAAEVLVSSLAATSKYAISSNTFIYNAGNKIMLNNLTNKSSSILDSGVVNNPQISLGYYPYVTWEKTTIDTVKSYFAILSAELASIYGEIKPFHQGDVRNLKLFSQHSVWESGSGNNRKSYIQYNYLPAGYPPNRIPGDPENFQIMSHEMFFNSFEIKHESIPTVYLTYFTEQNGSALYNLDSVVQATEPALKLVARTWNGYGVWTYLQNSNGKNLLKAKLIFIPHIGIEENSSNPQNAILIENYPNPFNNSTRINFLLPQSGMTTISVYNSSGQFIKNLSKQILSAGMHNMEFKADELNSGLFFVKIENAGLQKTHKILLTK